tara:strand:- start:8301 stop:8795 length:495 start_codon:yes stop_codon:yes gene_type:complete
MSEFRHTSGAIKTESQIRADNPNTSFPRGVLPAGILSDLGYTGILPTPQPNPSASTKIVVRDGIEQDSDKNWVQKWIEKDRFSDIEGGKTKDQQDAEYQTELDNRQKNILRGTREPLLAEADWQIHKIEDASGDASAWRTYRQQLRDITKASDIYDVTWPTKPS